jgi:hypothetical protein
VHAQNVARGSDALNVFDADFVLDNEVLQQPELPRESVLPKGP